MTHDGEPVRRLSIGRHAMTKRGQFMKTNTLITDLWVGDRVQMHPATDAFMQGDRYGTVANIGTRWIEVQMDRSGRKRRFLPADVLRLEIRCELIA